MADETNIAAADHRAADAFRAGFELSRAVSYADWQEAFSQWSGASAPEKHVAGRITPQMIRGAAGWSQSEDDLRDTLRRAADELERALAATSAYVDAELALDATEALTIDGSIALLEDRP